MRLSTSRLKGASSTRPEFEAINPKRKVPVVVHNGRVITESTVIIEYLDEAFPGPQLMPKEPYWRARRRLWVRWIDDEMHIPHISTLSFNIAMTEILGYKSDVHAAGAARRAAALYVCRHRIQGNAHLASRLPTIPARDGCHVSK